MTDDLNALRPIRPIRVEALTSAQLALNLPVPTAIRP
jgi:hypothetical protein